MQIPSSFLFNYMHYYFIICFDISESFKFSSLNAVKVAVKHSHPLHFVLSEDMILLF